MTPSRLFRWSGPETRGGGGPGRVSWPAWQNPARLLAGEPPQGQGQGQGQRQGQGQGNGQWQGHGQGEGQGQGQRQGQGQGQGAGWLLVAGWPARVSSHCRLGALENVGPKLPRTTHSVPPGWAEAGSKWKHPAPPGAAKGRVFCLGGGGRFAFFRGSAWGRDLASCKARRGPREATIPRLAPQF